MIVIGQPQHLGRRTLLLLLSRRTTVAFVLFIISGALAFLIPSLSLGIAGVTSLGGAISQNTVATISSGLVFINTLIFLGSIILFLITLIIGLIQYRNYIFVLDEFSLKMRKGLLSQTEIAIPYRQIQDINLVRTLSHRLFGVSRLIMITAGHEDVKAHDETDTIFDPIDADLAEEIRTFLERRIGVQIIEGTVQADTEEKKEESSSTLTGIENNNQNHA